jgi:hypothetical protein
MKRYSGVEVQLHSFLTSALEGVEWSVSLPGRFPPGIRAIGTHWIGGWVDSRAGLDAVARSPFFAPAGKWTPIIQHVNE